MFAETVERMSGGRLKIEPRSPGIAVPSLADVNGANQKTIEGHHGSSGDWTNKDKTALLFAGGPGGPFGMDHTDVMGWLYYGGGLELYQQYYREIAKRDAVAFPIISASPRALGWFRRPIESLDGFKAMTCQQTGLAAEVYKEMGQRVVNLPDGEVMRAVDRGLIDCAESTGGVEDLRSGVHTFWKRLYSPGMLPSVTVGELVFAGEVWRKLPRDLQEIVRAATMETLLRSWAIWQRQSVDAITQLRQKHNVEILKTPEYLLVEFLSAWDRIAAREAERDPFFGKLLESQRQYAAKVVPAKRLMLAPATFAVDYYWPVAPTPPVPDRPAKPSVGTSFGEAVGGG